jgi:hypothetical protein
MASATKRLLTSSSVDNVLQQLVSHFNQEIHQILEHNDDDNNNNYDDVHDPLNRDEKDLPKIMQYWLDEILPSYPSCEELVIWIRGYETAVRPLLLNYVSKSTEVSLASTFIGYFPTMIHFELLLSQWLQRRQQKMDKEINASIPDVELQKQQQQTLYKTIELVSTDLTLLTSERYFPKLPSKLRSNIILPTLLHLLDLILQVSSLVEKQHDGDIDQLVNDYLYQVKSKRDDSLRRCIVSLLAYEDDIPTDETCNSVSPRDVAPSLLDSSQHNIDRLLAFPPTKTEPFQSLDVFVPDIAIWNQTLDLQHVDWENASLSTSPWCDHVTSRVAQRVWKRLEAVVLPVETTKERNDSDYTDDSTTKQLMIVKHLGGLALFYKYVRAHFFGRDMVDWQPEMHTSQKVVLGRRVTKSQPVVNDPPHQVIPSRVVVALNSVRFLNACHSEQGMEKSPTAYWSSVMDDLFPVLASLVDSNRKGANEL